MRSTMNRRGTTLLEIMTVVAIIGALAAMSTVAFIRQRNTGRSRETTRLFLAYLRNARMLAVTSGVRHGVMVNTEINGVVPGFAEKIVLFRKPNPVASAMPGPVPELFYEVGDVTVAISPLTKMGQTGQELLRLEFDFGGGPTILQNGENIQVTFDGDGRPSVFYVVGGMATDQTAALNAAVGRRMVVRVRDWRDDSDPLNPTSLNSTSRCTELASTGTPRNLHKDATRVECL